MLSKVDSGTVTGVISLSATKDADSSSISVWVFKTTIISQFPISKIIWYEFSCNIKANWSTVSSLITYFNFFNWETQIKEVATSNGTQWDYSTWFIPYKSDNIDMVVKASFRKQNYSSWESVLVKNWILTYYYTSNINISKTIYTHKSLPREGKQIGNKATSTLFGMHVDNTRYTGE